MAHDFGGNPYTSSSSSRRWEALLTLVVLAVLSYSWMFSRISVPNERSRVYLAVAMVDHRTVRIDAPLKRFGRIFDLAKKDGHFYSDKAPGSSVLGAVVYGVVRLFTEPEDWSIEELINLMRSWLMIPIGLIGFLMLRRLLRYFGVDPPVIDIVSLGWILGSSAFHYSTAYFGHQIVAVCLVAAFLLLKEAEARAGESSGSSSLRLAAAGALLGLAGLTEYQAAIPCVLFTVYLVLGPLRRRPRALIAFAAGATPFALALLAYNQAAFGGPFELSYHYLAHAASRELHNQGIAGVTVPTWEYFRGSMFSLHRGLFTTSPLFLLAPIGLVYLLLRRDWRAAMVLGLTLAYFVAFISSSNMWYAGWGFGPRLLVPAMGLFAVLVAVAADRLFDAPWTRFLVRGLALCGVAYHQLVHAFFPEAPDSSKNPVRDYVLPMWRDDAVAPNLAQKYTELEGVDSLIPLAVLVAFVAAVILFRGSAHTRLVHRLASIAASLVVLVAFGALVFGTDAAWNEAKQTKWMKTIERWQRQEKSLSERAREAHRRLDALKVPKSSRRD